jgi:hypothetical protein
MLDVSHLANGPGCPHCRCDFLSLVPVKAQWLFDHEVAPASEQGNRYVAVVVCGDHHAHCLAGLCHLFDRAKTRALESFADFCGPSVIHLKYPHQFRFLQCVIDAGMVLPQGTYPGDAAAYGYGWCGRGCCVFWNGIHGLR